ncbi:MAG: AI-2E family transporter [Thermomicrobiales bacterium]
MTNPDAPDHIALTPAAKLFTVGLLVGLIVILWLARAALAPYIIGVLVIYMLLPIVHRIESWFPRTGRLGAISRPVAAISAAGLALVAIVLLVGTLFNPIVDQTEAMLDEFSTYWDDIQAENPTFRDFYEDHVPAPVQEWITAHVQQIANDLISGVASVVGWLLHTTGTAISTVLALVSVPLFIVYYLIDEKWTARTLRAQFPFSWSEDVIAWFRIFDRIFGAYTRGVMLESTIVGVITGFGYWAIGVELFVPLGVVAFVGEIVPIVGPWLAFFVSFPVILATQPHLAVPAMLTFFVIQMLEGWFLSPQIQGNSNDFTNSGTLLILAIGGAVGGALGMVLALPAAGLIRALSVYTFRRLQGDLPDIALAALPAFHRQEGHGEPHDAGSGDDASNQADTRPRTSGS